MLSEFVRRGMKVAEELSRAIAIENDAELADQLLHQIVNINHEIASTPAADINDVALKSDYIKHIALGDPYPDISEMEWRLIESMMDDIERLSAGHAPLARQASSN